MDYRLQCRNCGHQTNIDPALMQDDAPMQYCPECNEALIVGEGFDDRYTNCQICRYQLDFDCECRNPQCVHYEPRKQ